MSAPVSTPHIWRHNKDAPSHAPAQSVDVSGLSAAQRCVSGTNQVNNSSQIIGLRIGNVQLDGNLLLAPIAGYCDLPFRQVARSCGGIAMACTDLLNPEGVLRGTKRSKEISATNDLDKPLAMQLYGSDPDRLCQAARWAEDQGADVVDINMGCPVDKITKKDGGSKLLCNPDSTLRLVEKVAASLRRAPLTCKLRLGWDDTSIVAPYLAARLEEAGVQMITIHGRTAAMKFSGQARLDGIAQVVSSVKRIPVIGNGDVKDAQSLVNMMQQTGCAGVMIGRAALSKPWIFSQLKAALKSGLVPQEPDLFTKVRLLREHFQLLMDFRGERVAVLEFRRRISWYAKTLHPCDCLSQPMRLMESAREFQTLVDRFVAWRETGVLEDPEQLDRIRQATAAGRADKLALQELV